MIPKIIFRINGIEKEKYLPEAWEAIQIRATYDNNSIQPNIESSDFKFVQDGAEDINKYIDDGLDGGLGIFEGVPFEIQLKNLQNTIDVFKGMLDLTDGFKREDDNVICKIASLDGLNTIDNRSKALTYGYLESIEEIGQDDYIHIPYVVNYIFDEMQILISAIALYLIYKELAELVERTTKTFANLSGFGVGFSLELAANIIYFGVMVAYVIKLIQSIADNLISDVRYHKGIRVKKMLEAGANHVGLQFQSSLFSGNYRNLTFLPCKDAKGNPRNGQAAQSGAPNAQGYGYTFFEALRFSMDLFNAKLAIKDGIMYMESLDNINFWERFSTYTLPNIEVLQNQYNADELAGTYIMKFETDINDLNTIDNFSGTNYERLTNPRVKRDKGQYNLLKNLTEVNIPLCLGTRKNGWTDLELGLFALFSLVDKLINLLTEGGGTNFAQKILDRVGMLQMSSDFVTTPKLLLLDASSNRMKIDYRQKLCAKTLYDNFHRSTSFTIGLNDATNTKYNNQYKIFKDVVIPFGFSDFIKCIQSSIFKTANGEDGKFDKLTWAFGSDYAVVDYRIKSVYTKNLQESFITG